MTALEDYAKQSYDEGFNDGLQEGARRIIRRLERETNSLFPFGITSPLEEMIRIIEREFLENNSIKPEVK